MKYWVYPVDEEGKILYGFCPTVCNEKQAIQIANELIVTLNKFNVSFDCVVIDEQKQ